MHMSTLKETLLFGDVSGEPRHRYEIYKHEGKGGYFAMVYSLQPTVVQGNDLHAWTLDIPCLPLRSSYVPNARMECQTHWRRANGALAEPRHGERAGERLAQPAR